MIRLMGMLLRLVRRSYGTQLVRMAILIAVIVAFSSSGFLYFEIDARPDLTWGDAIWWSMVTMTTVGYGDLFPQTTAGRYLIGFPTMLFGISILGYLLSITASVLIEARGKELRGMGEALVKDHILLIHYPGLSRTRSVVGELRNDPKTSKAAIVLVDPDLEQLPDSLAQANVRFVHGDPTRLETLERASFRDARAAIVLARDPLDPISDHHNLAVVLTLEQLHPAIATTAECVDPDRVELFRRAGADEVVCIAQLSANFIVQETLDPGVQRVFQELTSNAYGQQLYVVPVRSLSQWTYAEASRLLRGEKALAIGVQRGRDVLLNPGDDARLTPDDRVVCIGPRRPDPIGV